MKMKHKLVILLLSALSVLPAGAKVTAKDAFTEAPKGVFMLLSRNDRLDMIDYYESGQQTGVTNSLDGESRITSMTEDNLTVQMTPASTYQLSILPSPEGQDDIVALIVTIATPTRDSRVSFYSSRTWAELDPSKILPEPELKTWLTDDGKKNIDLVESMVPFIMAEYSYDPATQIITAKSNLDSFLSADIYSMIQPYIKPQLQYVWDGKKFKLK